MRYNIAQLLKEQSGHTRNFDLREDIQKLDPDIAPLTTLDGTVQMIRTGDGVLVLGQLHASLELNCSRCLDPFAMPIKFSLEEEFHPTIDINTGANLPVAEDDEAATRINAHHEIDLTEVVRQDLLLAMPTRPICRSKCLGLCPSCGKNLNQGSCNCVRDEIDPRWEALKQLLDQEKK